MLSVKETPDGFILTVYIQPRASKNDVVGGYGDALKVKLTAPPVEGAANKMCIEYLAKRLGVPKSSIKIVSGHASRTKRLMIKAADGVSWSRLQETLLAMIKP